MKKIGVASAVAGLCLLFSCNLDNESVKPITSKVNIGMIEPFYQDTQYFEIYFETETVYECSNYSILVDASFENDILDVTLNDIYLGPVCQGGAATATNAYPFEEIEPGTYSINIRKKGGETLGGELVVGENDYTLNMASNADFNVVNTHLHKLPQGIVWGTLTKNSNDEEVDALADEFFELLADNGLADTTLAEGDYTFFKVSDTGEVTKRRTGSAPAGTIDFALYYSGNNKTQLISAINDFAFTYQEALTIEMYDWTGITYLN